jgi:hypothetical protein
MGSAYSVYSALVCGKLAVTLYGMQTYDKLETVYFLSLFCVTVPCGVHDASSG